MDLDYQFFPGRVKITNIIISNGTDKADITELMKEIDINTSINSSSATVEILISDAINFIHSFKPNAGDNISIEFGYKDLSKIFNFKVLKITSMADFTRQRSYIIRCVSNFFYKAMHRDVVGSLSGTTSEIAKGLFLENSDVEKINIWEDSKGVQKLVIPSWGLGYTMEWLARRSEAKNFPSRMYFFQDSNMKYNFMPIEKSLSLFKDKPAFKYTYNKIAASKGKNQTPNSADSYTAIKDLSYSDELFNIQHAYDSGKLAGIRYSPDIVNKTYQPVGYNYFESFSPENYLNSRPQFNAFDYGDGISVYDVNHSGMHEKITKFNKPSSTSNIRFNSLDDSQIIDILVVGNEAVDIGQIIELEVSSPEPASDNRTDKLDKRFSGKYYVVAKRDVYTEDTHTMSLGLTKESQIGDVT